MKKFYTVKELSEALHMSWSWTDKAIRAGRIQVVWFGGVRRVPEEEYKRLVEKGVE
jgi:excisionase family DNA binding protein